MEEFFFETWYKNPLIYFGIAVGAIGLGLICKFCYKGCSEVSQSSSEEPTFVSPSRPPAFVPSMPSAPAAAPFEDPPPYSEVAFKPNIWPLVDQLPSYDNIGMEGLPFPNMSQHPRSMPKDNF